MHFLQRCLLAGSRFQGELRHVAVGGVAALRTERQTVFAAGGEVHELVRDRAAHHAGVTAHGDQRHTDALPDALIGPVMGAILALQSGLIAVQRVGVLHPELAHPDQSAARAQLVAKLGLHLIHQNRELPVGGDFRGGVERHRLLVGHGQHQVALAAVAKACQGGVDLVPAARGLPQVGRMDHRQGQLLSADAVHLLAQDLLDLAQRAPAERQQGEDAGRYLAHVAGAQQEGVRFHVGLGGGVPQRVPKQAGEPLSDSFRALHWIVLTGPEDRCS